MQAGCSNPVEAFKIWGRLKDLPVGTLFWQLFLGEILHSPPQWRMPFNKRVAML
jgi:hypothetical protein